jgi:hypothetical protein
MDLPTLAVTPSERKLNTWEPRAHVATTSPNEPCIAVSRRPMSATWAAIARGTTAFITAADALRRRRVRVDGEAGQGGDIARRGEGGRRVVAAAARAGKCLEEENPGCRVILGAVSQPAREE